MDYEIIIEYLKFYIKRLEIYLSAHNVLVLIVLYMNHEF